MSIASYFENTKNAVVRLVQSYLNQFRREDMSGNVQMGLSQPDRFVQLAGWMTATDKCDSMIRAVIDDETCCFTERWNTLW